MKNNQSNRLSKQHKKSKGVKGIFSKEAQKNDSFMKNITLEIKEKLEKEYPRLKFRFRKYITKEEINNYLQNISTNFGTTLFVLNSKIKPDGGILEVQDFNLEWKIILVSEAKFQGKDVNNIHLGKLVGKSKNQDLMFAGNAIERAYKNIKEISNYMLKEKHFPYVIFLEGSNFLTKNVFIKKPNRTKVTLNFRSGKINRLDKLTAANFGMPFNQNLVQNKFIKHKNYYIMLQSPSIYTKGDTNNWSYKEMYSIMLKIALTSLRILKLQG
ncbi:EcoRI family type II restriction endonuclease [Mycoplasma sp. 480]|uniref:EcoRI family type II restriction endonuclease n=1 Tax=Mycoplasma sp. 480 TaxID=3440155 RepID=UPI003F5127C0